MLIRSDNSSSFCSSRRRASRNRAALRSRRSAKSTAPSRSVGLCASKTTRSTSDNRPSVIPSGEQRSEEHTSELQSLLRISYAVFCLKNKHKHRTTQTNTDKQDKDHMPQHKK